MSMLALQLRGGVAIAWAKAALVAAPLLFASTVANAGRDTTLTLNGNQQWNNFQLSVTVNPIGGWQNARIMLQTNNFDWSSDGYTGSGYQINLTKGGYPNGPDALVSLPSQTDSIAITRADCPGPGLCYTGNPTLVVASKTFSPAFDNPTRFDIYANNGNIQVNSGSLNLLDYTDPNPLPAGSIGLGAIWETKTTFANLVVSSGGNVLFQDNFNDSSSLNNYTITSGTAIIADNHLITSPATPTAPVPEPEEWAMMLLGFGMVGYQIRRKQKIAATSRA